MQLIVDSLAVSYTKSGRGAKNLLMLHGWADSSHTFESLAKKLDGYSIISLDLPGFGNSQIPDENWTLDDYSRFVGNFIKKIKVEIHTVVGHSNGGAIAVHDLSHGYFQSKNLILLASSGIRAQNKIRKNVLKTLAKPVKLAIKATPKSTQRRVKQKIYGAIGSDVMVAEHMRETFKNIVSADILEDARRIKIPTLLIYGDDDNATPLAQGQLLQSAIPNSRLMVLEKTGHFVHQEQAYKVARLIKDFIK